MKAEFISPFVDSTMNVLTTMCGVNPEPGKPIVKKSASTHGEVTGLIGMAGEQVSGNMLLSFEAPVIIAIVNHMLMEEFDSINDDVLDAVGELTNMISGGAKKLLGEMGYNFEMATPIMIQGTQVELKQLSSATIISIPFHTPHGMFWVEANLASITQRQ